MTADELVRLARARGLDGVCLTEHDRLWPAAELAALRQRSGFPIFAGVEVSTDLGHVLAFGLRTISPSAAELFAIAERDGGLLYLAHPARDGLLKVSRETVEYFASVEAVNGSDSRLQNLATTGLAKGFSRPGIGGSDAHTPAEVGRAATRFPGVLADDKALLAALHAGDYEAVSLQRLAPANRLQLLQIAVEATNDAEMVLRNVGGVAGIIPRYGRQPAWPHGRKLNIAMAIDPLASGVPSQAHVSLIEAGAIARARQGGGLSGLAANTPPSALAPAASRQATAWRAPARQTAVSRASTGRAFDPHTPIQSNTATDPDQFDGLLNRMGQKYNVPPLFLKAVMLSESGGRPDAVGDSGHSVGLFQLHDQGYGAGMGDARFDPETNADRAARGLAEAWQAGDRAGYTGEYAVRSAYDYSFNPGGGFAYQGDSVVRHYNELLAEQGLPALT